MLGMYLWDLGKSRFAALPKHHVKQTPLTAVQCQTFISAEKNR